ncbi:hypothetical protein IID10_21760, partial [candidate division KSB1 bacterium]|nr:hypothetical protein [candidate division KSB1 bacterium]
GNRIDNLWEKIDDLIRKNGTIVFGFEKAYVDFDEEKLLEKLEQLKKDAKGIVKDVAATSSDTIKEVSEKIEEFETPRIDENELENHSGKR